jgi:hypothetical protein
MNFPNWAVPVAILLVGGIVITLVFVANRRRKTLIKFEQDDPPSPIHLLQDVGATHTACGLYPRSILVVTRFPEMATCPECVTWINEHKKA